MTWDTCDAFESWRDARLVELEAMIEQIQVIARHVVRGRQQEAMHEASRLERTVCEFECEI